MIGKIWRRNCHHVTMHMQIQWWKFSSGCIHTQKSHTMNKLMQIQSFSTIQYSYAILGKLILVACCNRQNIVQFYSVSIRSNTIAFLSIFHVNFEIFVYYIRAIFRQFSHICEWNYFAKKKQFANSEANNCLAVYGSQICKYYILHMHYAVLVLNVFVMTKLSFLRKFALKFNMHQQISAVFSLWN